MPAVPKPTPAHQLVMPDRRIEPVWDLLIADLLRRIASLEARVTALEP